MGALSVPTALSRKTRRRDAPTVRSPDRSLSAHRPAGDPRRRSPDPEARRSAAHRRARGAQPGSPRLDQLPDALLREPELQPARAVPERAGAEIPHGFLDPPRSRREVDGVEG